VVAHLHNLAPLHAVAAPRLISHVQFSVLVMGMNNVEINTQLHMSGKTNMLKVTGVDAEAPVDVLDAVDND